MKSKTFSTLLTDFFLTILLAFVVSIERSRRQGTKKKPQKMKNFLPQKQRPDKNLKKKNVC